MRSLRLVVGQAPPADAMGAVLVRDVRIDGERWAKGRRLSSDDLSAIARPDASVDLGPRAPADGTAGPAVLPVVALEPDDVHEDDAASALAAAVAGPGLRLRAPVESRIDLVASAAGVLHVAVARLARLDAIDPLEVFTLFDGQVVREGEVVASVKIGPHAVRRDVLERGMTAARSRNGVVRVAAFVPRRVAAVVHEAVRPLVRERFERSIESRVASLGSTLTGIEYAGGLPDVEAKLHRLTRGRGRVDVVLTAGAASTDPTDPFFVAIGRLGGRIVRHGVPAHPGSMVWLGRVGATDLLGLPSCGAYSKATAADLLLPRLLTGERASVRMAASLGHGGILAREMRFRFPAYARDLEAPTG
ncbi:MAG: hypothetical protein M0Z49_06555 [Chloroflexi bacterium]|nr:hypothetical protein [Chloroflexota bacterium]